LPSRAGRPARTACSAARAATYWTAGNGNDILSGGAPRWRRRGVRAGLWHEVTVLDVSKSDFSAGDFILL